MRKRVPDCCRALVRWCNPALETLALFLRSRSETEQKLAEGGVCICVCVWAGVAGGIEVHGTSQHPGL